MTGQDHSGNFRRGASIWELRRNGLQVRWFIEAGGRRWERGRALDLRCIVRQPFGMVERYGSNDATAAAVGGGKAAFFDRALSKDNLIAKRTYAHRLDVDAELR